MVDEFFQMICVKNQFQKKMLRGWSIEEEERQELENILTFYSKEQGYRLEDLADAYDFINHMVLEETYYFVKNKRYRYSTFEEVNEIVYQNKEYMKKYMIGLCLSDYIWMQHLEMIRWFRKILNHMKIRSGGELPGNRPRAWPVFDKGTEKERIL